MNNTNLIALAQDVIAIERDAIAALTTRIDDAFVNACHLLHKTRGRIVVMGVGKSGHIGKKIAATLASTGSPAFFIHPSEASHGDMGMLKGDDTLLALSYSGESAELLAILPAVKRLQVPLITLTGRKASKLAMAADVNLDVSISKEACPLGLAPTSSTTATLVMGDALAMSLLAMRGFTAQDFAFSHPGGLLGKRLLLKVETLMHQGDQLPRIADHVTLKEALLEMTAKKLGMTTVVNRQGQLVGILTDGDLRRLFSTHDQPLSLPIQQAMSPHAKTITKDALATEALALMEMHHITSLVIIDDQQQPLGVVHIHDVLNAGVG